jgi:hypothetical protein
MGALERIAEAQVSSNLADDSMRLSDVDYIRASGWAAQANPEGLMLYRLKYANDHTEYRATAQRIYALAVGKAFRMRLTINQEGLKELADNTLRHWVAPICPACLGRGYEKFPNSPTLSDKQCKHCKGSGNIPLERAIKKHLELAEWVRNEMEAKMGAFVRAAKGSTGETY